MMITAVASTVLFLVLGQARAFVNAPMQAEIFCMRAVSTAGSSGFENVDPQREIQRLEGMLETNEKLLEMNEKVLTVKDELLAEKDKRLADIVAEKDKRLADIAAEKDKRLADIAAEKDKQLAEIAKRLAEKDKSHELYLEEIKKNYLLREKDFLRSRGFLTCRGILEFLMTGIGVKGSGTLGRLSAAANQAYGTAKQASGSNAIHPDILLLRTAYEKCTKKEEHDKDLCSKFYVSLFQELSSEIHGHSWSGRAVLNTFPNTDNPLNAKFECVMKIICRDRFKLNLEEPGVDDDMEEETQDPEETDIQGQNNQQND